MAVASHRLHDEPQAQPRARRDPFEAEPGLVMRVTVMTMLVGILALTLVFVLGIARVERVVGGPGRFAVFAFTLVRWILAFVVLVVVVRLLGRFGLGLDSSSASLPSRSSSSSSSSSSLSLSATTGAFA